MMPGWLWPTKEAVMSMLNDEETVGADDAVINTATVRDDVCLAVWLTLTV